MASGHTEIRTTSTSRESVRVLDRIATAAPSVRGVRSTDLLPHDWVIVHTRNSTYTLTALGEGFFMASGGWFEREGVDGTRVRVTGCTWGGSAILPGMIAAPDMFLEFDNGVRTTRIREVRVIRGEAGRQPH